MEQSSPEVFTVLHKKLEAEVKGSKTIELDDFELGMGNGDRKEEENEKRQETKVETIKAFEAANFEYKGSTEMQEEK